MKTTPISCPHPVQAVQEFGQRKALKFAVLLTQNYEKLSSTTRYLILLLFISISVAGSMYLLLSKDIVSKTSAPLNSGNGPLLYFPCPKEEHYTGDSLFETDLPQQTNNSHDQ